VGKPDGGCKEHFGHTLGAIRRKVFPQLPVIEMQGCISPDYWEERDSLREEIPSCASQRNIANAVLWSARISMGGRLVVVGPEPALCSLGIRFEMDRSLNGLGRYHVALDCIFQQRRIAF
jgi:hypothetical protein